MPFDPESTQTSRRRLLEAGRMLFARNGYEQTPTAAIAREAGTSESQLVRYYRTKAGLLEAIFDESWAPLNNEMQRAVAGAADAREALLRIVDLVAAAFGRDHDLAYLLLFEGRRVRGDGGGIFLSRGFTDFEGLLCLLVRRGKRDGTFRPDLSESAVAAALLGATEAMIRSRLIAERNGETPAFSEAEFRPVFSAMVDGLK